MPSLDPQVFLTSGAIAAAIETTVADINSPTELNSLGTSQGELRLARTTEAGDSSQTLYYLDTTSSAQSLPYIVTSLTAGLKWLAVSGHACNQAVRFAATVRLNAQTASRVVTTDTNKDLDTPATVSTAQAWAFSSTMSVVDGNLSITGSVDATKIAKFEVDGFTTGTTRTFTLPDRSDTVAGLGAQTFSGLQTFGVATLSDSGAAPSAQQLTLKANALGGCGWLCYSADNSQLQFDCEWAGAALLARHTDAFSIVKSSGTWKLRGKTGLTVGNSFTHDTLVEAYPNLTTGGLFVNYATASTSTTTGALVVTGGVGVGGAINAGSTIFAPAATTSISSIRLPHGAAPSSPVNGDMWTTTAGLFVRINGVSVGPLT